MNALIRGLRVLHTRFCCGREMEWCTWRAAYVCGVCDARR